MHHFMMMTGKFYNIKRAKERLLGSMKRLVILEIYPAAKAPLGSSGIFIDRSRHVECVARLEKR